MSDSGKNSVHDMLFRVSLGFGCKAEIPRSQDRFLKVSIRYTPLLVIFSSQQP